MPSVCFADTMMTRPPLGGPNTFLIDLVTRLPSFGWDVTVIAGEQLDMAFRRIMANAGVRVECSLLTRGLLPEERADRIGRWLKENGQDVFVVSNCPDASWLTLPTLPHSISTVSVAHHDVAAYLAPVHYYAMFLDCMVGVSHTITDHLRSESGQHSSRCRYIPYGVRTLTTTEFETRNHNGVGKPLSLGYAGRVVNAQKRILAFPALLELLRDQGMNFHFHIIGDGSDRAQLEELIQMKGLMQRVTFHGWRSGDELSLLYRELDVFLLLSDAEGLPIALLEAMAHGCVPVVSDIDSGMRTVVQDGINGFLIPLNDTTAQAETIQRIEGDRTLLKRMSREAWTRGQGYAVEKMTEAYDSLFRELLSSKERRDAPVTDHYLPMPSCRSRYPYWARKIKALFSRLN